MSKTKTLDKLHKLKERDLSEAEKQYRRAVDYFEEVGEELYKVLKKKETVQATIQDQMKSGFKIFDLYQYDQYHQSLIEQENYWQMKVHQARVNMNKKQDNLTQIHQEVKKFEKLIEKKNEEIKQEIKKIDMKFIDEISVQQYLRQKIGD